MPAPADARLERETHRYYQPWLQAQGSSLNVASHVESIAQTDLHGGGYTPRVSKDKALTAFAQLAALKLNVARAMVSLIDSTKQMILAEATQTLSMARVDTAKPSDGVWLGSTVLTRSDAVCEHCLINTCTARDDDGKTYTAKGLVVNDCCQDERFKTRSYVKQEGGVRFYAGVPIISRSGYMIGAYAVSDDKPRDGLTVEELKFMQEISQAVTEHLEWARDRVDRFKGERIVRGMASFIESCSSSSAISGEENAPENETSKHRPPLESRVSSQRVPLNVRAEQSSASRSPSTSSQRAQSNPHTPPRAKAGSLSAMFDRAADTLRESTLADGAVIFGATAGGLAQQHVAVAKANGECSGESDATSTTWGQPGSDTVGQDIASDSDTSPQTRLCKILAYSLADDGARANIEQGTALTVGTLEKYFKLFPRGNNFHFTDQGAGISSEDESASERESARPSSHSPQHGQRGHAVALPKRRKTRMDHRELLKKIPGAKSVMFLPLYDYSEEKLTAGCFLWTSVTGRMMNLDDDLSYLHAFGNSIMSEVARINVQKNEAAKTTFIASMSHELRSPLHGILGASEFLVDTATDSYQSGLITSIITCGKTLLDTLNHVLDYSKINKIGRAHLRKTAKQGRVVPLASESLESINMTSEVDLGVLVEEVVEAVTAGHSFKKLHGAGIKGKRESNRSDLAQITARQDNISNSNERSTPFKEDGFVSILLDIMPRRSWMVRTQPGALRRIIMNLLGNALKYTSSGFVAVSLRGQENTSNKVEALIRVADSGKGMSEEFQRDRLFLPFSQEDTFQPGTGLGLSIVKQIVDSLGGSVEVRSQQQVGTEVEVSLNFAPATATTLEDELLGIADQTKALTMALLELPDPSGRQHPPTHPKARLDETVAEICGSWFGMRVTRVSAKDDAPDGDVFLYSEPPSVEHLLERYRNDVHKSPRNREIPLIIVCANAEEAVAISYNQSKALSDLGKVVEVIPQPCGPRKLAKALKHCLRRVEEMNGEKEQMPSNSLLRLALQRHADDESQTKAFSVRVDPPPPEHDERRSEKEEEEKRRKGPDLPPAVPLSSAVSFPSPPPIDPMTPSLDEKSLQLTGTSGGLPPGTVHVLVVDDNEINLQLLTMFMKRNKFSYQSAGNGQEAVDKFKASCLPGPHTTTATSEGGGRFDFVLMDISMPVMDGMEATKAIREFERQNALPRTMVIALTGLASAQAQREAETAGIDVFLPKVRDQFLTHTSPR